jgi:hypothetical protein
VTDSSDVEKRRAMRNWEMGRVYRSVWGRLRIVRCCISLRRRNSQRRNRGSGVSSCLTSLAANLRLNASKIEKKAHVFLNNALQTSTSPFSLKIPNTPIPLNHSLFANACCSSGHGRRPRPLYHCLKLPVWTAAIRGSKWKLRSNSSARGMEGQRPRRREREMRGMRIRLNPN